MQQSSASKKNLDQFYYSSLNDTTTRDADQTMSKWTGAGLTQDGRISAAQDSLMIMVDQIWCWVVDERKLLTKAHLYAPDCAEDSVLTVRIDRYSSVILPIYRSPVSPR
jgi:hypothetical protein